MKDLLIGSILTGALSAFFQECMKKGMIFEKYRLWLVKHWRLSKFRILKPLGLCIYCFNFWISAIVYTLTFEFNIVNLFLFTGGSFFSVEIIRRIQIK